MRQRQISVKRDGGFCSACVGIEQADMVFMEQRLPLNGRSCIRILANSDIKRPFVKFASTSPRATVVNGDNPRRRSRNGTFAWQAGQRIRPQAELKPHILVSYRLTLDAMYKESCDAHPKFIRR
jgi:hypothetical protein